MHLFLNNSGALNANRPDKFLYIVSFTFKFKNQMLKPHLASFFPTISIFMDVIIVTVNIKKKGGRIEFEGQIKVISLQ